MSTNKVLKASRIFATTFIYSLLWLSYYQIQEIFSHPVKENLLKLLWALIFGVVFSYAMEFDFSPKFLRRAKNKIKN